ncbi:MAG TPA: DoxX family protein [Blastocatellia bacterium]|jgi:hypothetical protein
MYDKLRTLLFPTLAALGIAGTMFTATVFLTNRGEPFINPDGHSWEDSAFYLMAGICLALCGAGSWSLDAWLFGRRSNNPQSTLIESLGTRRVDRRASRNKT